MKSGWLGSDNSHQDLGGEIFGRRPQPLTGQKVLYLLRDSQFCPADRTRCYMTFNPPNKVSTQRLLYIVPENLLAGLTVHHITRCGWELAIHVLILFETVAMEWSFGLDTWV